MSETSKLNGLRWTSKAGDVGASEPECCSPYLPRVSAVLIGRIVGGRYFRGGGILIEFLSISNHWARLFNCNGQVFGT